MKRFQGWIWLGVLALALIVVCRIRSEAQQPTFMMTNSNCSGQPTNYGNAQVCYDTTQKAWYYWTGSAFVAAPISYAEGSLPACTTALLGQMYIVTGAATPAATPAACTTGTSTTIGWCTSVSGTPTNVCL